jgi:ATP-dependent protease ClpP protease subunit
MNTTKTLKSRLDFEEDDVPLGPTKVLPYAVQSHVRQSFMFKLDEPVAEPSYYRNVVDVCLQAKEDDEVIFFLNTPGGLYSGLTTVLDAILRTEATTVAVIQGECHSAGSIIALHCDMVDVSPYATMLAHSISYGTGGKDADIVAHVTHTTKQANSIVRETYEGFLTETEIAQVLDGKQLYMDAEEIVARLEARDEYRDEIIAERKKAQEAEQAPKPTPKKKDQPKVQE